MDVGSCWRGKTRIFHISFYSFCNECMSNQSYLSGDEGFTAPYVSVMGEARAKQSSFGIRPLGCRREKIFVS